MTAVPLTVDEVEQRVGAVVEEFDSLRVYVKHHSTVIDRRMARIQDALGALRVVHKVERVPVTVRN